MVAMNPLGNAAKSRCTAPTTRDHTWPVRHLYYSVAGLRQFRGTKATVSNRTCAQSATGADYLNVQVADLLAQRVPVDAQKIGGPDLVAAGGSERSREQRV